MACEWLPLHSLLSLCRYVAEQSTLWFQGIDPTRFDTLNWRPTARLAARHWMMDLPLLYDRSRLGGPVPVE